MQKLTSPFWTQPNTDYTVQSIRPQENHLGFVMQLPIRPPVSTPMYFGENTHPGRRELVTRPDNEYFPGEPGMVPMLTPKIPLVDLADPSYAFSRAQYTYYI